MSMTPHCPFLNRSDPRCSAHFRLDRLGEAFDDCFDQYQQCGVYRELLLERRVRRATASVLRQTRGVAVGAGKRERTHANSAIAPSATAAFVELTVARRPLPFTGTDVEGHGPRADRDAQHASAA